MFRCHPTPLHSLKCVCTCFAFLRDPGNNGILSYSILSQSAGSTPAGPAPSQSYFSIDNTTGWISLLLPLDYEVVKEFNVIVEATDLSAYRRSANATLTIQVVNINEHSPVFPPSQNISLEEDERLNKVVYMATAQDQDDGIFGQIVYAFHLLDGSLALRDGPFAINATSGDISLATNLDYESRRDYRLRIRASDTLGSPTGKYSELLLNVTVLVSTTRQLKTLSYGDVARLLPSPGKVNACNRSMRMHACSVA